METTSEKWITPKQAAAILGITSETLRKWRCSGRYFTKSMKVGSHHRFDEKEVLAYKQSRLRDYTKSVEV